MGEPQGDQHITITSLEIESSDNVPGSSVDTMGEPQGDQHITMTSLEIESSDNVPGSSVEANGEPRGDQHITMSSSLGVEASDDVPVSTTMPTSTAMVVEGNLPAVQGTNRYNLPPVSTNLQEYRERSQLFNRTRVLEAEAEVVSLRSELTRTQRRADQLQQLLEEDQALHSSDKRTQLHLRYLNKCTHAHYWQHLYNAHRCMSSRTA